MYVYHYYATTQVTAGQLINIDGIATLSKPILTQGDYTKLKETIVSDGDNGQVICSADRLTICSLNLLSKP